MTGAPESPSTQLLTALRSGSPPRQDAAFRTLLAEHGVTFLPDDRGRSILPAGGKVNQQPASVVQEAAAELWEKLRSILDQCQTDDNLRRLFATIIARRRLDRLRRRGNRGVALDAVMVNIASPTPKPRTTRTRPARDDIFNAHVERLLNAAASTAEAAKSDSARLKRDLTELYVVRKMSWPEIAAATGASVGALKVRFSRLRPLLLESTYAPFIAALPEPAAPIARAMLIDGSGIEQIARDLGQSEADVRSVFKSIITPRLRDHFGSSFLELLSRIQRHADQT